MSRSFGAETFEWLEQPLSPLGRDAGTGVAHCYPVMRSPLSPVTITCKGVDT